MYHILPYSYKQAKKLNVTIKQSKTKGKKIDVFKDGRKVASIGALHYPDYPTYLRQNKTLARKRRRMYKTRHRKDRLKRGTPGFYADKILW